LLRRQLAILTDGVAKRAMVCDDVERGGYGRTAAMMLLSAGQRNRLSSAQ
jgi:selenophosphate synthetase-related protein